MTVTNNNIGDDTDHNNNIGNDKDYNNNANHKNKTKVNIKKPLNERVVKKK